MSDATNQTTMAPSAAGAPSDCVPPTTPPATQEAPGAGKPADGRWSSLWMSDRDVVVFTSLAAIVLVLLVVRWGQLSGWGHQEIEIGRMTPLPLSMHLDPNEASWVELAQLDGVGEALALRIVEDRVSNGPYRTLDDLDRVKGIGPKTLERLRPYLKINPPGDGR